MRVSGTYLDATATCLDAAKAGSGRPWMKRQGFIVYSTFIVEFLDVPSPDVKCLDADCVTTTDDLSSKSVPSS